MTRDDLLRNTERLPDEEWFVHQSRLYKLAGEAEVLGPIEGGLLLHRIVDLAEYRDVHWRLARVIVSWGQAGVPWLRSQLKREPKKPFLFLYRHSEKAATCRNGWRKSLRRIANRSTQTYARLRAV